MNCRIVQFKLINRLYIPMEIWNSRASQRRVFFWLSLWSKTFFEVFLCFQICYFLPDNSTGSHFFGTPLMHVINFKYNWINATNLYNKTVMNFKILKVALDLGKGKCVWKFSPSLFLNENQIVFKNISIIFSF